ncbi:hypothetical protein B0H14DRAFT_2598179 [Mycena olivaceomarginata]|nr:hypothetical protein B0H14DRAFT_2598179 [Mycena olivaceomarginata]
MTYDSKQPYLGVYNATAVVVYEGQPYSPAWDHVLRTMDIQTLFQLALRGQDSDYLSKVPVEIFPSIFAEIKMSDRLSLSRVSRKFRSLYARELQAVTATLAVITEPVHTYIMDYDFLPTNLEFYAPNNTYTAILRFFRMATEYQGRSPDYVCGEGDINHVTPLFHPSSDRQIFVSRSKTDSAFDPIPYAQFSHLFSAITHFGAWLGYPHTTSRGTSFPSREGTTVVTSNARYRMGEDLRTYIGAAIASSAL